MDKYSKLKVGILALQGDFELHQKQLDSLGVKSILVKLPAQLDEIDALIMPGGESTTMDKLLDMFSLRQPLIDFSKRAPIFGTCAGMILLSKTIEDNQSKVKSLGLMDIDVLRNGYGRQVFSFDTEINAKLNNGKSTFRASFIRAPKISRFGENVEILAELDNVPVLVKQRNILAASFHAELSEDTSLLEYFLDNFLLAL